MQQDLLRAAELENNIERFYELETSKNENVSILNSGK
jgi:hypothetical protein